MSVAEQIAACKVAPIVAGVSGAGLTNAAFMRPGGVMVNFVPAEMPALFFWALAAKAGHWLHDVRMPLASRAASPVPWDGVLDLDSEQAILVLDEIAKQPSQSIKRPSLTPSWIQKPEPEMAAWTQHGEGDFRFEKLDRLRPD